MAEPMRKETLSDQLPSVEDYLRLEEASQVKHEYVAGELFAMVGSSKRHNEIAVNFAARLRDPARRDGCRVYLSDVKLRAAEDTIYYPDLMVVCGPRGEDPLVEEAPCLVVEVLSPGTETVDRREKALVYKRMPSLRAYLIVHQDRRRVERHWRDDSGTWRYADLVAEGGVRLPCPEVEIDLDEIYEGTDVSA